MKKHNNLNEQLSRMKSLMTEERLYGNLVDGIKVYDRNVITEGIGGKFLDEFVTWLKSADNAADSFRTMLKSKGWMSVDDYIDAFKNVNLKSLDDFVDHVDDFRDAWRQILKMTDNIPDSAIDGIFTFITKPGGTFEKLMTKSTANKNLFSMSQSAGKRYYQIIPEGPLRDNVLEVYRNNVGNTNFNTWLRSSVGDDVAQEIIKQSGKSGFDDIFDLVKGGDMDGAVIVGKKSENIDKLFTSKVGLKKGSHIIFTDPDAISNYLTKEAKALLDDGNALMILDKNGKVYFPKPKGSLENVKSSINKALDNSNASEISKSNIIKRIYTNNFYGPFGSWNPKMMRNAWENMSLTNKINWRLYNVPIGYLAKINIASATIYFSCKGIKKLAEMGMTAAEGEEKKYTLPSACLWTKHMAYVGSALIWVGDMLLSVFTDAVCEEINSDKGDPYACDNLKADIKNTWDEYKNGINKCSEKVAEECPYCKSLGIENLPENEEAAKQQLKGDLVAQHKQMVNEIMEKHDIKTNLMTKVISDLSMNYTSESPEIENLADSILSICLNDAEKSLNIGETSEGGSIYGTPGDAGELD